MARQRLTMFSKLLLTILIVGGIVFGGKYFLDNTEIGGELQQQVDKIDRNQDSGLGDAPSTISNSNKGNFNGKSDDVIKIGVVTWGGYAGGQYFNEGFEASRNSRFYKDYGLKVEFKVLDDFEASRNAFRADEVNLLWQTIDAFPTEVNGLSDFDPVVIMQADWSRGGDAVVVRRGITKVSDLRGKKIAVAELTPSHSFLIWLLEAGGLSVSDVTIVPQASAIDAAEIFKSQRVDAAVVWSPDDIFCVEAVPGARILENTKSASYIIADVFMAKRAYAERNRVKLQKLYEGWMTGAAEINSSSRAKGKAAAILAREFTERGVAMSEEDATQMIDNVRLTTHGDNKNFFGLNQNYKGVTGNNLYSNMGIKYTDLGFIEDKIPNWRLVSYPQLVNSTTLTSEMHFAELGKTFEKVTESDKKTAAIATKQVSIRFRTGEFKLDENSKYIIDREFVDIARAFGNSRIRIEGNTDSTGDYSLNVSLSKQRAKAVADYLVSEYGMPINRFVIVGNGPDQPVASNNTERGRSQNRRTDFELIAG
ncbi:MAG: phosphate ABC transporter substrate-binding/OmpA family protein [Saprospiraceae bacterium]